MVYAVKQAVPELLRSLIDDRNAVMFLYKCSDELKQIFDIQRVHNQTADFSKLESIGYTLDNLLGLQKSERWKTSFGAI